MTTLNPDDTESRAIRQSGPGGWTPPPGGLALGGPINEPKLNSVVPPTFEATGATLSVTVVSTSPTVPAARMPPPWPSA